MRCGMALVKVVNLQIFIKKKWKFEEYNNDNT